MSVDAAESVLASVTDDCALDDLPTAERIAIAQVHATLALADAVRAVAHGGLSGPGGLEALAMAIAGPGFGLPLSAAIYDGLNSVGEAVTTAAMDWGPREPDDEAA